MRHSIIFIFLMLPAFTVLASDTTRLKVPIIRQHFHEKIDEEQKLIDKLDGKQDHLLNAGGEEVNAFATEALFGQVDDMQAWVENNKKLSSNNDKVRYLRYIESVLDRYRNAYRTKEVDLLQFPEVLERFSKMMFAAEAGENLSPFIADASYPVAKIISEVFADNTGYRELKNIVYLKFCALNPDRVLQTIAPFVNETFADSLLVESCRRDPVLLYSYAQSKNSPEGKLIHRSRNPMVKAVADLSRMPNALFYFPFLDDILSGKRSIEEIYRYVGNGEEGYDSVGYFKLLVRTNIDYFSRMAPPLRDTPIAMLGANGLREMLRTKAVQHFITPINDLHNQSNLSIRMRAIEPLSAEEIYYMMVMGENEIYTSSFKHSFNRMLQKSGSPPRGDSLLQNVHFDYFRRFIRMAAGYNKLDTFLKTMPAARSVVLMKAFVSNLENSANLEDAVDVADAYGSITNTELLSNILGYVQENEKRTAASGNQKGNLIYRLLNTIFLATDSTTGVDLTKEIGIPSIYELKTRELMDDSGRVIQQVFFYGDDDGKNIFQPFLNSFSSKEWSISMKKEWVEIKSLKGKVWIYANRPLDYDANLDDSAQVHLGNYLYENGLYPSVVVHRGHSYWLPGTISRMPGNARLVVVGSCGGYKNLKQILDICPDAHIISTKEIGTGEINRPVLNYLNQSLLSGRTLVWKQMWSNLTSLFNRDNDRQLQESWADYVPPYKNLGAIFIKAYNKMTEGN